MNYSFINEKQTISEKDTFTTKRYQQFSKFIDSSNRCISILDIGCNTGRGWVST